MEKTIKEWFHNQRGIEETTLAAFSIRQEDGWVVFPYPNGEKLRSNPTEEKRRFLFNGTMELFESPGLVKLKHAFLVEGETDTLRLWQELGSDSIDIYGIPGINTWKPHYAELFKDYEKVFVILDNDEDYKVRTQVDNAWKQIRLGIGPSAKRVILPAGTKDICEFFDTYTKDLLADLCNRKASHITSLNRLDLTKEPPPMNWLVEDLICQGDVNLLIGNPGLGKSWLTMDLAIGVAGGKDNWLGRPIRGNGSVLYVDEENPEDIIYHRFKKLGLKKETAGQIHYLYRPGIWINKEPDALLEEALGISPSLIILDSLSRLHNEDENNANNMASLFREGITPLARETGAAVIIIHHTIKGDSDNSFQRARGSGDLTAVVDAAMDVRGTQVSGTNTLSLYKSRRNSGGTVINWNIKDINEGRKVIIDTTADFPF